MEAEPLITEALEGRISTLGPNHPDTLASRVDLLHASAYNADEAVWLAEASELIALTRSQLGRDDQLAQQAIQIRAEFMEQSRE